MDNNKAKKKEGNEMEMANNINGNNNITRV